MLMLWLIFFGFIFWLGYIAGKNNGKQVAPPPSQHLSQLQAIFDLAQENINEQNNKKKPDVESLVFFYALQYLTSEPITYQMALTRARDFISIRKPSQKKTHETSASIASQTTQTPAVNQTQQASTTYAQFVEKPKREPVDATSQLLYFGAFLLITSIALFVSFAEVNGTLKVLLVTLVAVILYGVGDYFARFTKSLKRVGATFISVALLTMPFIGLSTYLYILDSSAPELTWLVTSVVSFSAYLVSLQRYKDTLTSYLLIGSVVSSLLSVVGVLALPTYVFYWTMIATGLLLKLFVSKNKDSDLLKKPSEQFAQVLVPLAFFASLIDITSTNSQGELNGFNDTVQLSVSLALSTLYAYVNAKIETVKEVADTYAYAVHPLAVATLLTSTYSVSQSFIHVGIVSQLLVVAYCAVILLKYPYRASFVPTAIIVSTLSILAVIPNVSLVVISLLLAVGLLSVISAKYRDATAATLASSIFILTSFVVGQFLVEDNFTLQNQIWFSSAVVTVVLITSLLIRNKKGSNVFIASLEVVSATAVGVLTFLATLSGQESFIALFGAVTFGVLLSYWLVVKKILHRQNPAETTSSLWLIASYSVLFYAEAVILLLPDKDVFSYDMSAVLVGLLVSILGALLTRSSWIRWAGSVQWLVLPLVVMNTGALGASFNLESTTILYGISAFFLMGSRLIALGRVHESLSKKSIESLMGSNSYAYSAGFFGAVAVIYFVSLFSTKDNVLQAGILVVASGVLVWYLSYVERFKYASSLLPVLLQIVIARLLVPEVPGFENYTVKDARLILPLVASLSSIVSYSGAVYVANRSLEKVSVIITFTAPFYVFFFANSTLSMSVGLLLAGLSLLHYARAKSFEYREWAGAVIAAGISWSLAVFDYTNPIIHTHILSALFFLYAYLRSVRGEDISSNQRSMLGSLSLTLPLILAALTEEGIYSLLLLFEMSGLFIAGILLGRKHMSRIGLYVAIGAIAYQLRSYGYAVVALIAIVVIGFAIHSALKKDGESPN